MRNDQIEAWVLRLVDDAHGGRTVEDARVELKRAWPEPRKAARRIAGHANAARGESILWVIGIDEGSGEVFDTAGEDLATWWSQVQEEFDGTAPELRDLRVSVGGGVVHALYLRADRPPYVVRNPLFGQARGESIAWEVPWRDGTRVRSARRQELLRLLVPVARAPGLEVLRAMARVRCPAETETWGELQLEAQVFVAPRSSSPVFIPFHRCSARAAIEGTSVVFTFRGLSFQAQVETGTNQPRVRTQFGVRTTPTEAVFDGSGAAQLIAFATPVDLSGIPDAPLRVTLELGTDDPDSGTAAVDVTLFPLPRTGDALRWRFGTRRQIRTFNTLEHDPEFHT